MSQMVVTGVGAVSPAGWGLAPLMEMLESGGCPELTTLERVTMDGRSVVTPVARVPKLTDRSLLPKSPRLRRASAVGKFAAAAVFEALGEEKSEAAKAGELRVGVVCTMMNGCVNYSNRFFGEVLADPTVASPILFPETVYNAPSSHVSAVLKSSAPNDTLVGDSAEWFTGLELATEWLERGDCDACVVVSTEEADWLSAEAMGFYSSRLVPSEGAAAVVLETTGEGPVLLAVPDSASYAEIPDRCEAMARVWSDLGVEDDGETLWSDGRTGVARYDQPESMAWSGPRLSIRSVLGESLGASASLQTVVAIEWLNAGKAARAVITAAGGNEGAAGALFGA